MFTNCQSSTFLRFLIDWLPNYLIVANLDFAWALKYLVHVFRFVSLEGNFNKNEFNVKTYKCY